MVSNEKAYGRKFGSGRRALFAACALVVAASAQGAYAQDADPGESRFQLMAGAGVMWSPRFPGAEELELTPFPAVIASFETPITRWFIEFNELGLEVRWGAASRLSTTLGVGLGDFQRHADDRDEFAATASVKNGVRFFGQMNAPLPASFDLALRATYFPITSSYEEAARKDRDYGGMTFQLFVERELPAFPFFAYLSAGCTWMGSEYAEAAYGAEYATDDLRAYDADAGFHDLFFLTNLMAFVTDRIGVGCTAELQYLLGDAAGNPYAERPIQPTIGFYAVYRFW